MRGLLDYFSDPTSGESRAALVRRAMALFTLLLLAATWPLWTPQAVFPQVPLLRSFGSVPTAVEWIATGVMLAALCLALLAPSAGQLARGALLAFALSLVVLVLVDQQRLQAWAYQFLLMSLVLALVEARTAIALVRILIVSFYFHSALSKFDYSFLHTLGQQFLASLAGCLGASIDAWSHETRIAAALLFPGVELLIALGLCFRRSRSGALVGAVTLHVLLLVILGPFGLQHRAGVLIWNLYFIVQDILLFGANRWFAARDEKLAVTVAHPAKGRVFAIGLIVAAALLPLVAPWGWIDLWPAWGLYAPSAGRVSLLIHRGEIERLPDALRTYIVASEDPLDPWSTLRLDRWTLDTLGAPLYPQSRYQLGVAEAVIACYGLGHRARVVRFQMANRFTGERDFDVLSGPPQSSAAGNDYLFNSRPRQNFSCGTAP